MQEIKGLPNGISDFNITGKKSPTSAGGAMNCPTVF